MNRNYKDYIDHQTVVDYKDCIGKGAYGEVYACERMEQKNLGIACCVKVLQIKGCTDRVKLLNREVEMSKLIRKEKNPNIVEIFDIIELKEMVYIVMQRCDGDLRQQMRQKRSAKNWFTSTEAIGIMKQLLNGYKTCQLKDMIHRDLKPENILLHKGIAQIADFGLGRTMENLAKRDNMTMVGTPLYTSPQVFYGKPYSSLADMYSLGVIFHELIYDKRPIETTIYVELFQKLEEYEKKPIKLTVNNSCPPEVRDIIERMLRYHEQDRMSWSSLFDHPLFKQDNQGNVLPKAQVVNHKRKGTIRVIPGSKSEPLKQINQPQEQIPQEEQKIQIPPKMIDQIQLPKQKQQNQQDNSQKEQTIIIQKKQQPADYQNSPNKKSLSIRIISISQSDL